MPTTLEDLDAKLDKLFEQNAQPSTRFLSVQGAADYASLSDVSIRRFLSAGKLTARRPCKGKVLIDRHQIDSLVMSATTTPRTGRGIRTGEKAG